MKRLYNCMVIGKLLHVSAWIFDHLFAQGDYQGSSLIQCIRVHKWLDIGLGDVNSTGAMGKTVLYVLYDVNKSGQMAHLWKSVAFNSVVYQDLHEQTFGCICKVSSVLKDLIHNSKSYDIVKVASTLEDAWHATAMSNVLILWMHYIVDNGRTYIENKWFSYVGHLLTSVENQWQKNPLCSPWSL